MLAPHQVIPLLTHSDSKVRSLAIRYLADAHDPSPATADDIWKNIDAFGGSEYNEAYHALPKLPQTDESLRRTLDALNSNVSSGVRSALENVIRKLKSGLLMRYMDLIEQARLSDETLSYIKHRIELSSQPAMELWEQLMEMGKSINNDRKRNYDLAERLVDALSHSPEAAGWAISTLNDESITDWREIFAVDVLAALRHRPAADLVIERLGKYDDSDATDKACMYMLARVASPQAVESVAKRYATWDWGPRITATEIFRIVKLPAAEMAAFELLQSESDDEARTFLAWALCEQITTHGPAIDVLVKMINEGDYAPSITDLDVDVAALCTIHGRTPPSTSKRPIPTNPFSRILGSKLAFEDDDSPRESVPVTFDTSTPAAALPIRRQAPKVGRNDPCPCRSGKKYKKCCGK